MILVWGPASDPPVERVVSVLRERAAELVHVDDQALPRLRYDIRLEGARATGWIESAGRTVRLDSLRGVYRGPASVRGLPRTPRERRSGLRPGQRRGPRPR